MSITNNRVGYELVMHERFNAQSTSEFPTREFLIRDGALIVRSDNVLMVYIPINKPRQPSDLTATEQDLLDALRETTSVLEGLRRGYGVEVSSACYPALNNARALLDKLGEPQ